MFEIFHNGKPIAAKISEKAVSTDQATKEGRVFCKACGNTFKVDSAKCIQTGWPSCCGATMALGRAMETTFDFGPEGLEL